MTTNPEAVNAMSAQPIPSTTQPIPGAIQPDAVKAADLTPVVAWSRRVRRVGGFIQAAFAAFWLGRASLAIGGRAPRIATGSSCASAGAAFPAA